MRRAVVERPGATSRKRPVTVLLPNGDWVTEITDRLSVEPPRAGADAVHLAALTDSVASGRDDPAAAQILESTEFYVPAYMGPASGLELMARMPRLRVVQALTTGVDDVLAHLPVGVTLCSAAGVHAESTAELAIGLAVACVRGIDEAARAMPEGRWTHAQHPTLIGAHALVVGAGALGRGIVERLRPFGARVRVVSRTPRDAVSPAADPGLDSGVASGESMDRLHDALAWANVVFLAVPLTPSTTGLLDAAALAALGDGALVVNVSRGAVLDQGAALAECGRLRFALDVTVPEPLPPGDPLWHAPGVLITPHSGGDTTTSAEAARTLVLQQILRVANSEPLRNVVQSG